MPSLSSPSSCDTQQRRQQPVETAPRPSSNVPVVAEAQQDTSRGGVSSCVRRLLDPFFSKNTGGGDSISCKGLGFLSGADEATPPQKVDVSTSIAYLDLVKILVNGKERDRTVRV